MVTLRLLSTANQGDYDTNTWEARSPTDNTGTLTLFYVYTGDYKLFRSHLLRVAMITLQYRSLCWFGVFACKHCLGRRHFQSQCCVSVSLFTGIYTFSDVTAGEILGVLLLGRNYDELHEYDGQIELFSLGQLDLAVVGR